MEFLAQNRQRIIFMRAAIVTFIPIIAFSAHHHIWTSTFWLMYGYIVLWNTICIRWTKWQHRVPLMVRAVETINVVLLITLTGGIADSPFINIACFVLVAFGLTSRQAWGIVHAIFMGAILFATELIMVPYHDFNQLIRTGSQVATLILFGALANVLTYSINKRHLEEESQLDEIIQSFAQAVGSKDTYTLGHSHRVMRYSLKIGKALGMPSKQMRTLRYAALLHDIGKIHIPETILNKEGKLTDEEWEILKSHSEAGYQILRHSSFLSEIALIVRHHHERIDGLGYPMQLSGEEIPFLARLIHVADAFDAMTSQRTYNFTRTSAEAIKELKKHAGTQFDSRIVEVVEVMQAEQEWMTEQLERKIS